MKKKTYNKLMEAWAWCDMEDKSTEFMLTYMADIVPSWDESDVADWMFPITDKERTAWYEANPDWFKKYK